MEGWGWLWACRGGGGLPPGSGQTTRTRAAGTPATSTLLLLQVKACHQGQTKQPEPEQLGTPATSTCYYCRWRLATRVRPNNQNQSSRYTCHQYAIIVAGEGLLLRSGQTTRTRAAGTPATSTLLLLQVRACYQVQAKQTEPEQQVHLPLANCCYCRWGPATRARPNKQNQRNSYTYHHNIKFITINSGKDPTWLSDS